MLQVQYHTETQVQFHASHLIDLVHMVSADSFTLLSIGFFKHSFFNTQDVDPKLSSFFNTQDVDPKN
jgi:hypothetical protein